MKRDSGFQGGLVRAQPAGRGDRGVVKPPDVRPEPQCVVSLADHERRDDALRERAFDGVAGGQCKEAPHGRLDHRRVHVLRRGGEERTRALEAHGLHGTRVDIPSARLPGFLRPCRCRCHFPSQRIGKRTTRCESPLEQGYHREGPRASGGLPVSCQQRANKIRSRFGKQCYAA